MQNILLSHMRWCHYRTITKEAFWNMTMCLWVSGSWHPKDCNAFIPMWTQTTIIKATTPQNIREPLTHLHSIIRSKKIRIHTYTSGRMLNSRKTSGISQQKFLILEWKIKLTVGQFCLCLLMLVLHDSSNWLCRFQSLCCDFHKGNCDRQDDQTYFLSFQQFPTSFFSCIFHVHSSNLVTEEY